MSDSYMSKYNRAFSQRHPVREIEAKDQLVRLCREKLARGEPLSSQERIGLGFRGVSIGSIMPKETPAAQPQGSEPAPVPEVASESEPEVEDEQED